MFEHQKTILDHLKFKWLWKYLIKWKRTLLVWAVGPLGNLPCPSDHIRVSVASGRRWPPARAARSRGCSPLEPLFVFEFFLVSTELPPLFFSSLPTVKERARVAPSPWLAHHGRPRLAPGHALGVILARTDVPSRPHSPTAPGLRAKLGPMAWLNFSLSFRILLIATIVSKF
jgi:hypothetical protein